MAVMESFCIICSLWCIGFSWVYFCNILYIYFNDFKVINKMSFVTKNITNCILEDKQLRLYDGILLFTYQTTAIVGGRTLLWHSSDFLCSGIYFSPYISSMCVIYRVDLSCQYLLISVKLYSYKVWTSLHGLKIGFAFKSDNNN